MKTACLKHTSAVVRKKRKIRGNIRKNIDAIRLTVIKSSKHIYAQIFNFDGSKVLGCASSLSKDIKEKIAADKLNKTQIAALVGKGIAEKAKTLGIENMVFDRSGYKFHGRIKALAEAVNEAGIKC